MTPGGQSFRLGCCHSVHDDEQAALRNLEASFGSSRLVQSGVHVDWFAGASLGDLRRQLGVHALSVGPTSPGIPGAVGWHSSVGGRPADLQAVHLCYALTCDDGGALLGYVADGNCTGGSQGGR